MLAVTRSALQYLSEAAARAEALDATRPETCLRLIPRYDGSSLSLNLQLPAPDDSTFEIDGEAILAMPGALLDGSRTRTLDLSGNGDLVLR